MKLEDQLAKGNAVGSDVLSASLRLFAPAIYGFEPTHFGGFCYNFISELPTLRRFLRPILRSNPLHKDLTPDARRLSNLKRRTELLALEHPWEALRARICCLGAKNTWFTWSGMIVTQSVKLRRGRTTAQSANRIRSILGQ